MKTDAGRYVYAAGLTALVDVTIKPEVDASAKHMRAMNKTQVVENLRCSHPASRARCIKIGFTDRVEVKGRYIRPGWICFALRKQEAKSSIPDRQLIDYPGRKNSAVAKGQAGGPAEYFALRRKAGKHLWPAIGGSPSSVL